MSISDPLLIRKSQFAIEVEGTEGTAEVLAAADVQFEVEELSSGFTNEVNERNPLRTSLSKVPFQSGIKVGEITGRVELVGGGDDSTNPPTHDVILAMGFAQVGPTKSFDTTGGVTGTFIPGELCTATGGKVVRFLKHDDANATLYVVEISGGELNDADTVTGAKSGATVTIDTPDGVTALNFAYMPDPSSPSFTAGHYMDGMRKLVFGARGTGTINVDGAGQLPYLNFTLNGKATKPIDAALFTGLTLPTVIPLAFLSAGVVIVEGDATTGETDTVCLDSFALDFANTVARRPCANDAAGIFSFRITDRAPQITIDPEAQLEADLDFWSKYDAGTAFGFYAQIGSDDAANASKRLAICAPNAQFQGIEAGDRDGLATYSATLRLNGSEDEGDDEVILAFF